MIPPYDHCAECLTTTTSSGGILRCVGDHYVCGDRAGCATRKLMRGTGEVRILEHGPEEQACEEEMRRRLGGTGMAYVDPVDGQATIVWHADGDVYTGFADDGDFVAALKDALE